MQIGKIYTVRLNGDPLQSAMNRVPLNNLGCPCMKNKCIKVKKFINPKRNFGYDGIADILNQLDGSIDMPNIKFIGDALYPKLLTHSKFKKGKTKRKKKSKSKKRKYHKTKERSKTKVSNKK